MAPRPGEQTLRTEDIIDLIKKDKQIAVVMLAGVQYYTGQFFEIEKITKAGHEAVSTCKHMYVYTYVSSRDASSVGILLMLSAMCL